MKNELTDSDVKLIGMQALVNALGEVDAARFVSLILREPFDYTEWQQNLREGQTVEEISQSAAVHTAESPRIPKSVFGSARGQVEIGPDFDRSVLSP